MNLSNPTMADLFQQLGLGADETSMQTFIDSHRGLDKQVRIDQAAFWTPSQAAFIQAALEEDAEWAELIDQLNSALR